MLTTYIVAYDVCDDKRRNEIYKFLRGWGDHLQYSVFRLILSSTQYAIVTTSLHAMVHHKEDQILLFNLGPAESRGEKSVEAIGLTYTHPERHAIII